MSFYIEISGFGKDCIILNYCAIHFIISKKDTTDTELLNERFSRDPFLVLFCFCFV